VKNFENGQFPFRLTCIGSFCPVIGMVAYILKCSQAWLIWLAHLIGSFDWLIWYFCLVVSCLHLHLELWYREDCLFWGTSFRSLSMLR